MEDPIYDLTAGKQITHQADKVKEELETNMGWCSTRVLRNRKKFQIAPEIPNRSQK